MSNTQWNILLLGSGGLGCEILKCLIMSGFKSISIVDYDLIELSNLSRQFLFSESDIGKNKATIAAHYINSEFQHFNVSVTPYSCKMEELNLNIYAQFDIIICSVDNIESRRWLNSLIHSCYQGNYNLNNNDAITSIKLFIEGGIEGFKGHVRYIQPFDSSCLECSLPLYSSSETYPICHVTYIPTKPEDCIKFVYLNQTPQSLRTIKQYDELLQYICNKALERAKVFNISGVTMELTKRIIHKIVRSLPSVNSLIASIIVEKVKQFTLSLHHQSFNFFMYTGDSGIYTNTFHLEKKQVHFLTFPYIHLKKDCSVCCVILYNVVLHPKLTLNDFINKLSIAISVAKESIISLITSTHILFVQNPIVLKRLHEKKLFMTFTELLNTNIIKKDETLFLSIQNVNYPLRIQLIFLNDTDTVVNRNISVCIQTMTKTKSQIINTI